MKFTLLSATLLACLSTLTSAAYCDPAYNYCGRKLMTNPGGWYPGYVYQAMHDKGWNKAASDDVLFDCNADGALDIVKYCGTYQCIDGRGQSDFCAGQ
ncbi:hypothetical protein C8R43DRAFT_1124119 [Mycena crocata]|nr:hypothetical protein C8R43DRAFT_1124112 [Mycena crocata]KAJ7160661.1 hypothetical protein C8R43DRAFT_1124119 [Mycena crocata]